MSPLPIQFEHPQPCPYPQHPHLAPTHSLKTTNRPPSPLNPNIPTFPPLRADLLRSHTEQDLASHFATMWTVRLSRSTRLSVLRHLLMQVQHYPTPPLMDNWTDERIVGSTFILYGKHLRPNADYTEAMGWAARE